MLIEAGIKRHPKDPLPTPEACDRLPIAEQARKELLREISRKISKIQNKALEETEIRKLNDELNEMARRKYAWDRRIHELGGIERKTVQLQDRFGLETPNVHGTFFFGRAKELPEAQATLQPHREDTSALDKERAELMERLDYRYYGFDDELEDLGMLEAEKKAEEVLASAKEPLADWVTGLPTALPIGLSRSSETTLMPEHIPSQDEVKKYLLDKRKAALLAKLD